MSSLFLNAIYTVDGAATGPAYDPTPGASTDYPCKAIFDEWGAYYRSAGLVSASDRKVLVLADTLPVTPVEGGRITIDGVTLTVASNGEGQPAVSTDPAKALWTLRCTA